MIHSKVFKRACGTRYRVNVQLSSKITADQELVYYATVDYANSGKRRFLPVNPDYEKSKMPYTEAIKDRQKLYLQFVTEAEILEAKLELWNKIKPV